MPSCGEILVKMLENYGVDTVFGIPGNHTVQLYRGLADSSITHVSPRHEQGAGFMADGYARASGKPGVCFLISGPGLTNALTPMMQALADSVPLLVISSVAARHQLGMGEGRLHELPNQQALLSQATRFSHTLMRPEELPKVLARAFAVFHSARPGPVHIELPLDVITAEAGQVDPSPWPVPSPPAADPAAIAAAVALLTSARQPLLLLGGGSVAAAPAAKRLAQQLDAPVLNTVNAKGVIAASHPLSVGASPSLPAVRALLAAADVVLAVGTEFGETDYDMLFIGELQLAGKLIRVDIDPLQLSRNVRADIAIVSDAANAMNALAEALPAVSRGGVERVAEVRRLIQGEQHVQPQMKALFATIQSALPGLLLVGDSTLPTYYAVWQYECETPRSYFHSATGGGTLGYAIPAAFGAKRAVPQRAVAALIGDGSAQFTLSELAAGVEARCNVAVMIWNNSGYGEIKQGMLASGIEPVGVDVQPPDFLAAARGLGCQALRVDSLATLAAALQQSQEVSVPTVIELRQEDFASDHLGQWY